MKVALRQIYAREDCFSASSKDADVIIQAYHHLVHVTMDSLSFCKSERTGLTLEQFRDVIKAGLKACRKKPGWKEIER